MKAFLVGGSQTHNLIEEFRLYLQLGARQRAYVQGTELLDAARAMSTIIHNTSLDWQRSFLLCSQLPIDRHQLLALVSREYNVFTHNVAALCRYGKDVMATATSPCISLTRIIEAQGSPDGIHVEPYEPGIARRLQLRDLDRAARACDIAKIMQTLRAMSASGTPASLLFSERAGTLSRLRELTSADFRRFSRACSFVDNLFIGETDPAIAEMLASATAAAAAATTAETSVSVPSAPAVAADVSAACGTSVVVRPWAEKGVSVRQELPVRRLIRLSGNIPEGG